MIFKNVNQSWAISFEPNEKGTKLKMYIHNITYKNVEIKVETFLDKRQALKFAKQISDLANQLKN